MIKCDKCGQEITQTKNKRKKRDIWRNINELLGLDFESYEEHIFPNTSIKEAEKLENAIKKKLKQLSEEK
jgi:hypothetical protein